MKKYISIVFFEDRTPMRLHMVTRDFRSFFFWLQRNNYKWTAINVYNKHTTQFITQLRPNNYWNKLNF